VFLLLQREVFPNLDAVRNVRKLLYDKYLNEYLSLRLNHHIFCFEHLFIYLYKKKILKDNTDDIMFQIVYVTL